MSFVFYPKLERSCPDVGHCPHLGGASLGSVVFLANQNDEWMQALYRQVDSLRAENEAKRQKIEALTGEVDYAGGLVTDCYSGYHRHATKIKQKCLSHLKRTAKDWLKVTPEKATGSRQFFADVMTWVKRGCRWHRRWKAEDGPEKEREAAWLREEQVRLEAVALDSKKAQTLQGRIRRYSKQWLTFLDHPGVPPTNNLAEQAIRFLVVLRKVTFGSRTRAGARRLGAMLTVIQTAKRQGQNVIRFLVALCTLTPNEAARAMYARC